MGGAATACGDSDDGGTDTPPPEPTADETTSAPQDPTPTDADAPADPVAAEKEVRANWEKFFDPEVKLADKEAVLENGPEMREVLRSFSGDERGQQVTAKVTEVDFTSDKEADVTYSLELSGATVMPDASGTSVNQDDTWKVSVKTLCALVQLSGNASPAPGC
ncbi:hypothetical protein [Streptomyces sp. E11-3]|uniref:hypothetical protein n=1 Tax=Streptomyces sp. E11-3 TaxID=3110112 RepID=UPI00397FE050